MTKLEKLITRYDIELDPVKEDMLRVYRRPDAKALAEIKASKPDIMEYLKTKEARQEELRRKTAEIPGLAEIKSEKMKYQMAMAEYHKKVNDYYEEKPPYPVYPTKPQKTYDFDAAYKKYPQAHAYLKAEKMSLKDNYELGAIGKRALEKVIDGDWKTAMEDMQKANDAFVAKHLWD